MKISITAKGVTVLANIADTKITRLEDLMPWSYAQRN
jgi:hypothetical protein